MLLLLIPASRWWGAAPIAMHIDMQQSEANQVCITTLHGLHMVRLIRLGLICTWHQNALVWRLALYQATPKSSGLGGRSSSESSSAGSKPWGMTARAMGRQGHQGLARGCENTKVVGKQTAVVTDTEQEVHQVLFRVGVSAHTSQHKPASTHARTHHKQELPTPSRHPPHTHTHTFALR